LSPEENRFNESLFEPTTAGEQDTREKLKLPALPLVRKKQRTGAGFHATFLVPGGHLLPSPFQHPFPT
jgi:hypothetical protein